jgi:hypothetical protein
MRARYALLALGIGMSRGVETARLDQVPSLRKKLV